MKLAVINQINLFINQINCKWIFIIKNIYSKEQQMTKVTLLIFIVTVTCPTWKYCPKSEKILMYVNEISPTYCYSIIFIPKFDIRKHLYSWENSAKKDQNELWRFVLPTNRFIKIVITVCKHLIIKAQLMFN